MPPPSCPVYGPVCPPPFHVGNDLWAGIRPSPFAYILWYIGRARPPGGNQTLGLGRQGLIIRPTYRPSPLLHTKSTLNINRNLVYISGIIHFWQQHCCQVPSARFPLRFGNNSPFSDHCCQGPVERFPSSF